MRHVLPGGGCALPGLRTPQKGKDRRTQAGASAAPPGNGYPAPCATFCPVAAAPYRAWELHRRGRTVGRCKRSAARQWTSGAMRHVLPGGGCALPGLRTPQKGKDRRTQAGASAAPPGNGYPAPCATFCPVAAAPYRAWELHRRGRTVGRCKRSAARQWTSGAMRHVLPGGGCALPGLRAPQKGKDRRT